MFLCVVSFPVSGLASTFSLFFKVVHVYVIILFYRQMERSLPFVESPQMPAAVGLIKAKAES